MRQAALTIGIIASAIVHVCILMIPVGSGQPTAPAYETLQVEIREAHAEPQVKRPVSDKRPRSKRDARAMPETKTSRLPEPPNQPAEIPVVDEMVADTAPDSVATPPEEMPAFNPPRDPMVMSNDNGELIVDFGRVVSYLRQLVERRKVYPMLARQRGFEGEVLLGFRVVDDGAIQSVHVARSSGNRLLDQSALQTLKQIERITPELWHVGTQADLQLSVVYRLIGS